ncbi:MAG: DHH family phosphoesterase [Candidatus Aureabacteria bacterium]|nr:DHH family phosphoesterase [Candidatus Auribacterota bacterium]
MKQARNELKATLLQEITRAVEAHDRFAVFSHEEPDGDAIGSQIALALALRKLGKQVVSLRLEKIPSSLEFLNRDGAVEEYRPGVHRENIARAQVVVVVDASSYHRMGSLADEAARSRALTINIDHHRDNEFFADINFVRFQAGGAAELVFEVIRAIGVPIEGSIAEAIYVGICTDTLGFKYIDPEGNLISVISELVKGGIDIEDLQERLYYLRPDSYLEDIAGLLRSVHYENGGSLAWFAFPAGSHLSYYQRDLAMEGLHQLMSVKRIRAAVMLHEEKSGVEVWLRSKTDVDVGKAAERLGGGGHKTASGVFIKGMNLGQAVRAVLSQINAVLQK